MKKKLILGVLSGFSKDNNDKELIILPGGGGGGPDRGPIKGLGALGGAPNILPGPPELLRQFCLSSLLLLGPPPELLGAGGGVGAGPSPSSAMRDMYSSSIAVFGPSFQAPVFLPIQSLEM